MGGVLTAACFIALMTAVVFAVNRANERRWKGPTVARRLGLQTEEGRYRGRPVRFQESTEVCVAEIDGGPELLVIETRAGLMGQGVLTGDGAFDHDFHVTGPRAQILALLDEGLRARLSRTFRGCRVKIAAGKTRIESRRHEPDISPVVRDAAILLEDLEAAARKDVRARLRDRATQDETAGVRFQALDELLASFPGTPEAEEARAAAQRDADPEVRRVAGVPTGALAIADAPEAGALSPAAQAGALSPVRKKD